ncbi:MAG TPA: hypothetical protein VJ044_19065 [Candidatus Hodarchaeales archaeon]|nr:hypothetical protein [Candidatus Hodarchaeales archaeon]
MATAVSVRIKLGMFVIGKILSKSVSRYMQLVEEEEKVTKSRLLESKIFRVPIVDKNSPQWLWILTIDQEPRNLNVFLE